LKSKKDSFVVDLQIHLMLYKGDSFEDLLNLMVEKGIDAVALLEYDWNRKTNLKNLIKENKEFFIEKRKKGEVEYFGNGFYFDMEGKDRFLILGKELKIEGHHFLAPGIISPLRSNNLEKAADEIWAKGGIPILDHPFSDPERSFGRLRKKKKDRILKLIQKKKIALEYNGYCIRWVRELLFRDDPNKKVLELGKEHNLPVVPTTDLHAETKESLKAIGTGLIKIPKEKIDPKDLVFSIRKAIFDFNFTAFYRTVSFKHFFFSFGLPYLKNKLSQT